MICSLKIKAHGILKTEDEIQYETETCSLAAALCYLCAHVG